MQGIERVAEQIRLQIAFGGGSSCWKWNWYRNKTPVETVQLLGSGRSTKERLAATRFLFAFLEVSSNHHRYRDHLAVLLNDDCSRVGQWLWSSQ